MTKIFFTVEEANRLLPTLIPILEALKEAEKSLRKTRKVASALAHKADGNGGGKEGSQLLLRHYFPFQSLLQKIESFGVLVKNIESGLIDFPYWREGREIYLCWEFGESGIRYWHEVETGYAGRQPIDTL
ncbi:MAG TPA: DUF2203 domain-containing protein [bacterium]|nr:DUF2203 domain-containing protein [bacterium]